MYGRTTFQTMQQQQLTRRRPLCPAPAILAYPHRLSQLGDSFSKLKVPGLPSGGELLENAPNVVRSRTPPMSVTADSLFLRYAVS